MIAPELTFTAPIFYSVLTPAYSDKLIIRRHKSMLPFTQQKFTVFIISNVLQRAISVSSFNGSCCHGNSFAQAEQ
jgi:hypothetical protein